MKDSTIKNTGRVYTPNYIVDNILDLAGYNGPEIIKKHVIDNSCGDGAFLVKIVQRYCENYQKLHNSVTNTLKSDLEKYIHGIEIDGEECRKCIDNLDNVVKLLGITSVKWDVNQGDTLSITKYDGKMDYVLGNPPYVRVHNLGDEFSITKQFSFAQNGMTDLYIVFYQIGLMMLNDKGVLGYITPSSFYNSLAGDYMRKFIVGNSLLKKIVDLKHFQAFNATTYTTIVILQKGKNSNDVEYYQFDGINKIAKYICLFKHNEFYIDNKFYFASSKTIKRLNSILTYEENEQYFVVKNGFATLADKVFIGEFDFDVGVIPVIKASTGAKYTCVYPYDNDGIIVEFNKLPGKIKEYLLSKKDVLLKRSIDTNSEWYAFGRTQGIKDTYKEKYAINALIRSKEDIKLVKCERGVGVYSGLYILTNVKRKILEDIVISDEFVNYISTLSKYKSGGYYTFSSADLSKYLNYVYSRGVINE